MASSRWTTDEKAFILNFTDYCILHNKSFRRSVLEALKDAHAPARRLNEDQISAQVSNLAKRYQKEEADAVKGMIFKHGTKLLDPSKIPSDLKKAMNTQRRGWGFNKVGAATFSDSRVGDDTLSEPKRPLKKPLHPTCSITQASTTPRQASHVEISSQNQKDRKSKKNHVSTWKQRQQDEGYADRSGSTALTGLGAANTTYLGVQVERPIAVNPSAPLRSPSVSSITVPSQTSKVSDTRDQPGYSSSVSLDLNLAMNGFLYMMDWVMQVLTKSQVMTQIPEPIVDRFSSIRRTLVASPGQEMSKLMQDLIGADEANVTLRRILSSLVQEQHWYHNLTFPHSPSTIELADEWSSLRDCICLTDRLTKNLAPQLDVALYLACQSDNLVSGNAPYPDISSWTEELAVLCSTPHAACMIMSVTFLTSLFPTYTEPMYDPKTWDILSKLLETTDQRAGTESSRQLDTMCLKFLFESKDFQHNTLPRMVDKLAATWYETYKCLHPSRFLPLSMVEPEPWIKRALHLKHKLMISSMEYKIHYFQPGTPFEASWMQAIDEHGFITPDLSDGKTVLICLFPGLFQHTVATDAAAYTRNTRFFVARNSKESFVDRAVVLIAKAVVWLQD